VKSQGGLDERDVLEIVQELSAERWTGLDRRLQRIAHDGGVDLRAVPTDATGRFQQSLLVGRLQQLVTLDLAAATGPGTWRVSAEAERTLDAVLTSASAVSDTQQQRIIDSLSKRFGRQIRLAVQLDPTLIGGARLQVGDRVIDGSVRNGLDKLATALRA
jgi:F-type H+-transporting ATPase subunit delta